MVRRYPAGTGLMALARLRGTAVMLAAAARASGATMAYSAAHRGFGRALQTKEIEAFMRRLEKRGG
jgi:hypothetical protein